MTSPASAQPTLRIVVVDTADGADAGEQTVAARVRRRAVLQRGLVESGYEAVATLAADACLAERLGQLQPDLIVIDLDIHARGALAHILGATRDEPRAIVVFTDDADHASMQAALDAGVSAYIVAGLQAGRVKPVLDVALARFRRECRLLDELTDTRRQLAERKLIERAKGVLMARNRLGEEQAYQKLRSMAMNRKLRLAEVAQRVLDVEDLL